MIFVTVGTQKFQMNRLISAVDELAATISEPVFVQKGHSTVSPMHCEFRDFVDADTYYEKMRDCSILITHAGVGSIMSGLRKRKRIIAVPRSSHYAEHVDNHQKEIADAFAKRNYIMVCDDVIQLEDMVKKARVHEFSQYAPKGGNIEEIILSYIDLFD